MNAMPKAARKRLSKKVRRKLRALRFRRIEEVPKVRHRMSPPIR